LNERELILRLKEAFSNQFKKQFSNNKLSEFFGSRALLNETIRKERKLSERVLYRIQKSIEENLTLINKDNALNALRQYIENDIKKTITSSYELDLIQSLREIISNELGEIVDYTNLGRFFGNQSLFSNAINKNYSFKAFTLDKLEWIVNKKLSPKNKIRALKSLNKYRRSKNFNIGNKNPIEELINTLKKCFSNQFNKFYTKSEISDMIGGKALFSYALTNESRLNHMTLIKIEQLINENLTGNEKQNSFKALKKYKQEFSYPIDSNESKLIKVLFQAFSTIFEREIYLLDIGELIGSKSLLNEALRNNTQFTKLTIDKIEYAISANLEGKEAAKAMEALNSYRSTVGYNISEEKSIEVKLADDLRNLFNSNFNKVHSYNELGKLFGDRQLFNRILYEQKVIKNTTIMRMIKKIQSFPNNELKYKSISLLHDYMELKRYKRKMENVNKNPRFNEEFCRCIFEELFTPYEFPTVSIYTFDWLRGPSGGPMHIDGYCTDLNLGFEYNGIQHYEVDGFYNKTQNDLQKQREVDSHKKDLCLQHHKRIIYIPYSVKLKDRAAYILEKCREFGISPSQVDIDEVKIEKEARQRIKNRLINQNKVNGKNLKNNALNFNEYPFERTQNPYPYNNPIKEIDEMDFTEVYTWMSPQVREQMAEKAESLQEELREGVETKDDQFESNETIDSMNNIEEVKPEVKKPNTTPMISEDITTFQGEFDNLWKPLETTIDDASSRELHEFNDFNNVQQNDIDDASEEEQWLGEASEGVLSNEQEFDSDGELSEEPLPEESDYSEYEQEPREEDQELGEDFDPESIPDEEDIYDPLSEGYDNEEEPNGYPEPTAAIFPEEILDSIRAHKQEEASDSATAKQSGQEDSNIPEKKETKDKPEENPDNPTPTTPEDNSQEEGIPEKEDIDDKESSLAEENQKEKSEDKQEKIPDKDQENEPAEDIQDADEDSDYFNEQRAKDGDPDDFDDEEQQAPESGNYLD